MKRFLPVKMLLYPVVAAATLLSAANGLHAATYNSYVQCRCAQTNMGGKTQAECCADQYYAAANPSLCCTAPTVCTGGTNGVGGWIISGTASGPNPNVASNCQTCCGTGWAMKGMDSNTTCNGTQYVLCHCQKPVTQATLVYGVAEVSDGQGSCDPTYGQTQAASNIGLGTPAFMGRCVYANPHDSNVLNNTGTARKDACMAEWGTLINQYLSANSAGLSVMCYVGGGNTQTYGMQTCSDVGYKYYLLCKVQ